MKFGVLLGLGCLTGAFPIEQAVFGSNDDISTLKIPSEKEAALIARTLVNRESLTNVNTIRTTKNLDGSISQIPVSSMEYYVDCDNDGNPYWLVVDIGSPFQNIRHGSSYSLTIRAGDHPQEDQVDDEYPGGIKLSPAGQPRINLFGELKNVTFTNPLDEIKLSACFIKRHPDAKFWLPSTISPHSSHWTKFIVKEAYFVGGFGDRAYIGTISGDHYHDANLL